MMLTRRNCIFATLSFVLFFGNGCGSSAVQPAPPTLPTTTMHLGKADFTIEIANTDPTREFGLMKRDDMAPTHGMIFVFGDEQPRSFWMKNTRFPLDILYLDSGGKIVSIKQMKAYDLTAVPSDAPAKYAIELNLGAANAYGIRVGDHVDIPPDARQPKD
jgi:uncharacterized membrane protein (UPF0127 family)